MKIYLNQPDYFRLPVKSMARKMMIEKFRELTGLNGMPQKAQYWCLAGRQTKMPGAELIQLRMNNFLQPEQFFGIDNNVNNIKLNSIDHPKANWIYDDWLSVINSKIFNPFVVNLDTNATMGGDRSLELIRNTMMCCERNVILFSNVMMTNPRNGKIFCIEEFIKKLNKCIPSIERRKWVDTGKHIQYNATGRTRMATFIFIKQ